MSYLLINFFFIFSNRELFLSIFLGCAGLMQVSSIELYILDRAGEVPSEKELSS